LPANVHKNPSPEARTILNASSCGGLFDALAEDR
jgi:hypothetical protein